MKTVRGKVLWYWMSGMWCFGAWKGIARCLVFIPVPALFPRQLDLYFPIKTLHARLDPHLA